MHKCILVFSFLCVFKICCSKISILETNRLKIHNYNENKNLLSSNKNREFIENVVTEEIQDGNNTINEENLFSEQTEDLGDKREILNNTKDKFNSEISYNIDQLSLDDHLKKLESIFNTKLPNGINLPKITPPQFMTDLYESSKKSNVIIHGSPIVKAYLERDPSTRGIFLFALDDTLENEEITEAELHIYRTGLDNQDVNYHSPYFLIRVYQIMPMPRYQYSISPDVHQLLNVHYISAFSFGWQVFKVKRAVDSWRSGILPNLGLLITATTIFGDPVEIRFARRGLHSDQFQPSLIVYKKNKNDSTDQLRSHSLSTRSIDNEVTTEENIDNTTATISGCRRVPYIVDFENTGWNFIVAPTSYEAFACNKVDRCENMMTAMNGYSYIMTLSSKNSLTCVPIKFKPISVLYLDSNFDFILRVLPDMIVTHCACR